VYLNYARRAFTDHRAGDADHRLFLWSWIVMQTYAGKNGPTGGQLQQAPASI
jgi:hypothetical protein